MSVDRGKRRMTAIVPPGRDTWTAKLPARMVVNWRFAGRYTFAGLDRSASRTLSRALP